MNRQYAVYMGLCLELVGLVLVLLFVGREIDNKFQWHGLGIVGGAVLAMIIWVYHLILIMKKEEKE